MMTKSNNKLYTHLTDCYKFSYFCQVERIIEILINFNQFLPKIIW